MRKCPYVTQVMTKLVERMNKWFYHDGFRIMHPYLILSRIHRHTPDNLGDDALPVILKKRWRLMFVRVKDATKGSALIFLCHCPLNTTATEEG
jgi:hypothetical protein